MKRIFKFKIFLIVAILFTLFSLAWAFTAYEKVAYATIVAVFGFVGFYLSELAKQVIRAKHVANQGWAYITNFHYSNQLEPSLNLFATFAKDWQIARNSFFEKLPNAVKRNIDYTSVDREFKEKIFQYVTRPEYLTARVTHFENQRKLPGKIEAMSKQAERMIEETQNWHKYLSDQDIALLGPEVLLYVINYRSALLRFLQSSQALFTYLREAKTVQPNEIMSDMQEIVFHLTKSQLELAMLQPLIEAARTKNILEITVALLK